MSIDEPQPREHPLPPGQAGNARASWTRVTEFDGPPKPGEIRAMGADYPGERELLFIQTAGSDELRIEVRQDDELLATRTLHQQSVDDKALMADVEQAMKDADDNMLIFGPLGGPPRDFIVDRHHARDAAIRVLFGDEIQRSPTREGVAGPDETCLCRHPPEGMIGWDRGMVNRDCPLHGHEALPERRDPQVEKVVEAMGPLSL